MKHAFKVLHNLYPENKLNQPETHVNIFNWKKTWQMRENTKNWGWKQDQKTWRLYLVNYRF